ncbi:MULTISPECIES: LCP family protein [Arthrobacter]|uniref:LytR family transcriptional regulator n=1 Tax=Arthrobacter oryzae TaxID=409290 RepID=A0A3N0C407_9MICC|nr:MULTISPECIES: LCP family protein [Arthrobacter]QYF89331.1 LCP family protein [Arthrobacter sp. PAMC25284]RNL57384.1 LytR family transcriptional regulator [Arthrobacter oryzae]
MTYPHDTDGLPPAPATRRRRNAKKRKGRMVLIVVAALVALVTVVAAGYLFNLGRTFDSGTTKIEQAFPDESTRPKKTDGAMNILVMGSDSRGATGEDAADGQATNQRADTLMLMHIPADRKNIYTMSLMRDLWVTIPGHGEAKINAALALGGTPLMVQTVESIFNQRIDHVAMIDFEGFKGLTDALGGVTVDVKVPFTSSSLDRQFTAGKNTLNGEEALVFVRERYAFTDGDYQRVRNQQEFLKAIMQKSVNRQTLTNPVTINNMVSSLSPFISVDESLDAATVAGLAVELKDVRPANTVMFTLPTNGIGTSSDGQSIVLTDPEAIQGISDALAAGKLGDYVAANGLTKGN